LLPFMLSGVLLALTNAPAPENLIAPIPASALKSTSVIKRTMSTFSSGAMTDARRRDVPVHISLKPDQSLMGLIRSGIPSQFRLNFTNQFFQPIVGGRITRVGDKVFLINRLHRAMEVNCEVLGSGNLADEPYELVLCEIDTGRALAEPSGL